MKFYTFEINRRETRVVMVEDDDSEQVAYSKLMEEDNSIVIEEETTNIEQSPSTYSDAVAYADGIRREVENKFHNEILAVRKKEAK